MPVTKNPTSGPERRRESVLAAGETTDYWLLYVTNPVIEGSANNNRIVCHFQQPPILAFYLPKIIIVIIIFAIFVITLTQDIYSFIYT